MSKFDFSQPQRQSVKGVLLYFGLAIQKFVKAAWPLIVVYLFNNEKLSAYSFEIYLGLAGLGLLFLVHAILSYLYFYFYIDKEELVIKSGYLKRIKLAVPFERIQSINFKQNVFQQILAVQTVEIDTAGSAAKEIKIRALTSAIAKDLNRQLLALRDEIIEKVDEVSDEAIDTTKDEIPKDLETKTSVKPKLILGLSLSNLFKIGISENHIKSAILVIAVVSGFFQQVAESLQDYIAQYEEEVKSYILQASIAIFIGLGVLLLFVGVLYSIIRIILKYYNLIFYKVGNRFELKAGLLSKKSWTIPYTKIQVFIYANNPIRRLLDFVTVQFVLAGSSQNEKKQNISIPGVPNSKKEILINELFPGEQEEIKSYRPKSFFFVRYFLILIAFPLVLLIPTFDEYLIPFGIGYGVWVLIVLWMTYLTKKKRVAILSTDLLEIRRGAFGEQFFLMELHKVQRVRFSQNFIQARKKTASIKIYTAGGVDLSIPYIYEHEAWELYNYLLYRVESCNKKWM